MPHDGGAVLESDHPRALSEDVDHRLSTKAAAMTDTPAMDWSTTSFADHQPPAWFVNAPLGIFIHWGAYSVPAWAEPTGELGAVPMEEWFAHNPYAEWYLNTIGIEGSPAWEHHRDVHGGAPYDDFLDAWRAESFDPSELATLFAHVGADYVIPTTRHHDGSRCGTARGPGSATRCTADRDGTWSATSPPRSGPRGCGSGSTTPAGSTGSSDRSRPSSRPLRGFRSRSRTTTSTAGTPPLRSATWSSGTHRRCCGTTSPGRQRTGVPAPTAWSSCSSTTTPACPTGWSPLELDPLRLPDQ